VIELRKTELFARWLDGSMACAISGRGRAFKHGSSVLPEEILEMLRESEKVFQSCELIMVPVIGCISNSRVA